MKQEVEKEVEEEGKIRENDVEGGGRRHEDVGGGI